MDYGNMDLLHAEERTSETYVNVYFFGKVELFFVKELMYIFAKSA